MNNQLYPLEIAENEEIHSFTWSTTNKRVSIVTQTVSSNDLRQKNQILSTNDVNGFDLCQKISSDDCKSIRIREDLKQISTKFRTEIFFKCKDEGHVQSSNYRIAFRFDGPVA